MLTILLVLMVAGEIGGQVLGGAPGLTDASRTPESEITVEYHEPKGGRSTEYTAGVALYRRGRDAEALAALKGEIVSGVGSVYTHLALSDLYFRRGDMMAARHTLEALGDETPRRTDRSVEISLAWIKFEQGAYASASQALETIARELPKTAAGAEAVFALGWQDLLRGRYAKAAARFDDIAWAEGDSYKGQLAEQAQLLEGQALMWQGEVEKAGELFSTISARFDGSTVADDAERDRAWCDYLQGDVIAAVQRLRQVKATFGGEASKTARAGDLDVDWSLIAQRGAVMMHGDLRRAFARRPRGMLPLPFLLAVGDRFAGPDARRLLRIVERKGALGASVPMAAIEEEKAAERSKPHVANPQVTGEVESKRLKRPRFRLALAGVLIVAVFVFAIKRLTAMARTMAFKDRA